MLFLEELKRMMDELPDTYLEPKRLDQELSSEFELVGELSDEEKRLFGVICWVEEMMDIEMKSHDLMHNEPGYPRKLCLELGVKNILEGEKQETRMTILLISISGRLNLPESDFIFDGNAIYACKREDIGELRYNFQLGHPIDGHEDKASLPDDLPSEIDPKKMN